MIPPILAGDPDHHIIEDMWLGVTVASQGPAGRVLVSEDFSIIFLEPGRMGEGGRGSSMTAAASANGRFCGLVSLQACVFPDPCTLGRGLSGHSPEAGHGMGSCVTCMDAHHSWERAESAPGSWTLAGSPSWAAGCRKRHSPDGPGTPWH